MQTPSIAIVARYGGVGPMPTCSDAARDALMDLLEACSLTPRDFVTTLNPHEDDAEFEKMHQRLDELSRLSVDLINTCAEDHAKSLRVETALRKMANNMQRKGIVVSPDRAVKVFERLFEM